MPPDGRPEVLFPEATTSPANIALCPAGRFRRQVPLGPFPQGGGALWRGMSILVALGIALTLAGIAGILWCLGMAIRLRRPDMAEEHARVMLRRLVLFHMIAIGAAFIGLGLLVVGLLLR